MSISKQKAEEIITAIESGEEVESLENRLASSPDEWQRYSSKAYNLYLNKGEKRRKNFELKPHTSVVSKTQLEELLLVNSTLADFALLLPVLSTTADLNQVKGLIKNLPTSESNILDLIGKITMHPKIRVMQKKGRIGKFAPFEKFTHLVDAATLSFYRTNFISCYLTLTPIIEGIIIRWMGYEVGTKKPEFEAIRKFFKNAHKRQPCPSNILFHNIYIKACDEILNKHLYKPSTSGLSHANFNRHVASHLLNDDQFATKENCIRLFILLDSMTEIYLYESRIDDPRFNLRNEELNEEIEILVNVILDSTEDSAEHKLLGMSIND